MFGVVHACQHTLDDELIEQWRAHLCGLCLSLRDSRGQLSRAVTNTDAVMLSVLVEAQQTGVAERSTAGPCPLRGMRSAQVVPAKAVAARLGATASLTLAAAKAGDVLAERQFGLTRTTMRDRAVGALAVPLRNRALADAPMADSVHAIDLLDDLAGQGQLESAVRAGDSVLTVTAAERPRGRPDLRLVRRTGGSPGERTGAAGDRRGIRHVGPPAGRGRGSGRGSPLRVVQSDHRDRGDPDRMCSGSAGRWCDGFATCLTSLSSMTAGWRKLCWSTARTARCTRPSVREKAVAPRRAGRSRLGYPGPEPPSAPPTDPGQPPDVAPAEPPPAPPDWIPPDPPPKEPPRPPFWPSLLPWIGVYCTGFACCASHQNPCTGKRHDPGCSNCDCGDCCDCGDGCCCDCDCNC